MNFDLHWKRARRKPVLDGASTGNGLSKGQPVKLTPAQVHELMREAFEAGATSTRVRNRVVAMLTRGMSLRQIANRQKIGMKTVHRIARAIKVKTPAAQARERNRQAARETERTWKCPCGHATRDEFCRVCAARGVHRAAPDSAYD